MSTRGFTLVELLVVLVIMGVAATLVPRAWTVPVATERPDDVAAIVTTAQRLAVARGEAVELALAPSGDWQVTRVATGEPLRAGHLGEQPTGAAAIPSRLRVDALGTCHPLEGASVPVDWRSCTLLTPAPGRRLSGRP